MSTGSFQEKKRCHGVGAARAPGFSPLPRARPERRAPSRDVAVPQAPGPGEAAAAGLRDSPPARVLGGRRLPGTRPNLDSRLWPQKLKTLRISGAPLAAASAGAPAPLGALGWVAASPRLCPVKRVGAEGAPAAATRPAGPPAGCPTNTNPSPRASLPKAWDRPGSPE